MNKAALLADLAARSFVLTVGTPELLNTMPDGTKYYSVPTLQNAGDAASYLNVQFYVWREGEIDEAAYYKDVPPQQKTRNTAFEEWMIGVIDAAPDSYKGIQIIWKSERWEMIIYSILEGTPLAQHVYYFRTGDPAPVEITNFKLEWITSLLRV